jgi:hypothetical protein
MKVGHYWRKTQPKRDGKGHELFEAHYKQNEDNRRGAFTSASVIEKKRRVSTENIRFLSRIIILFTSDLLHSNSY